MGIKATRMTHKVGVLVKAVLMATGLYMLTMQFWTPPFVHFKVTDTPGSQTVATGKTGMANPALPWRALSHLHPDTRSVNRRKAHAPAYLISSFLDHRRLLQGRQPQLVVIMAVDKQAERHDWSCLVRCVDDTRGEYESYTNLRIAHIVPNNEPFFQNVSATGHCPMPRCVDTSKLGRQAASSNLQGKHLKLYMTVVKSSSIRTGSGNNTGQAGYNTADKIDPRAWVLVEPITILPSHEADRSSSQGPIAVCTPPLHTDAYAATLLEWAEFARLMGASKVMVYAFNPGPLIKPLLDYYEATGYFDVQEWIIPYSILKAPKQQCKLPFFHPSNNRQQYDSPNCTFHQDNYNIPWWGQVLAIQDCVHRAMASHQRWVAVTDFDEYIMPVKVSTPDWPSMIKELSQTHNQGQLAAEYCFAGVKQCSGCIPPGNQPHRQFRLSNASSVTSKDLHASREGSVSGYYQTTQEARIGAPLTCLHPSVGFEHILWSAVVTEVRDHVKCIVDPFAVEQAFVHGSSTFVQSQAVVGRVAAPTGSAVKLHDRAHDIHASSTFATAMLPLLLRHVHNITKYSAYSDPDKARIRGSLESNALTAWPNDLLCQQCGGGAALGAQKHIDYTMCNLYGQKLHESINRVVLNMHDYGTFRRWHHLPQNMGNVYGGHSFDGWAPPQ